MSNEGLKRAVDVLLNDAQQAIAKGDWGTAGARAATAMSLDPTNALAQRLVEVVARRQGSSASALSDDAAFPVRDPHRLAHAIDRIAELVPFSVVAQRVINALNDETMNMADLARLIATEPALTTKVLRVANSAYYLRPNRVSSIQEAITLLGSREVESLAVAACITSSMPRGKVVSHHDFWRFSLCVATIASVLERISGARPMQAFTAGIVHNIGLLALDLYSPDGLKEALNLRLPGARRLHDRERHVFGFTDADLGAGLARRWLLPAPFIDVIEHMGIRADEAERAGNLIAWVVRARIYVRSTGVSDGVERSPSGTPPEEWTRPPLSETISRLGGIEQVLRRADTFLGSTE